MAVPTALLNAASQGWFMTYVFGIAACQPHRVAAGAVQSGHWIFGDMGVLAALFVVLAAILLVRYRQFATARTAVAVVHRCGYSLPAYSAERRWAAHATS